MDADRVNDADGGGGDVGGVRDGGRPEYDDGLGGGGGGGERPAADPEELEEEEYEEEGDELGPDRKANGTRPSTPSGGKRKACVVHLDGCRYTIVASPPGHENASRQNASSSSSIDTSSFPRTGSLTLLKKTMSGGGGGGGEGGREKQIEGRPHCGGGRPITTLSYADTCPKASEIRRGVGKVSVDASNKSDADGIRRVPPPPQPPPPRTTSMELNEMERLSAVDGSLVPHLCSLRLRHLLSKVSHGDLEREDVAKNLEYVIRLLDSAHTQELRNDGGGGGGGDDDGYEEAEFNRVETDVVPNEVRDWLAMTFTRSNLIGGGGGGVKQKSADKPKFRSVAHAIRAGILVDRIYRRVSNYAGRSIPTKIVELLKRLDDWSFDVFALDETSDGHSLRYVGFDLMQRYDLINKFKISTQTLDSLLARLEQGYSKYSNPYHNLIHASDVAQTMHHIISKSGLSVWLTDIDVFSAIVAALIHDFEHTGTTNTFHVNTSSEMALLYNDKAILENHHVSSSFRLLKDDEYNIVSGLKADEFREFRNLVIEMVLATDMSFHFQQIKNMKSTLNLHESVDRTKALSMIVHCADISHPAKKWELHHRWTELLMEEFFRQGDREASLGLQISPLCDRMNTHVAESQIGFIDYIVDPSLQVMSDMIERLVDQNSLLDVTANELQTSPNKLATNGGEIRRRSQSHAKCHIEREWESCLVANKHLWKERAEKGWISPLQQN